MKTKINNKNKKNRQKDKKILLTFLLLTIRISFPMGTSTWFRSVSFCISVTIKMRVSDLKVQVNSLILQKMRYDWNWLLISSVCLRRLTDNIFSNLMVSFLCNIVSAMAGWFILNSCNIAGKWFMESRHLTNVKESNKAIIREIWIPLYFMIFNIV